MFYSITREQVFMIVLVVALLGALIVMPMFTNKKRQQAVMNMYSSLKVGDKIMTIGGIIGVIKAINQTSPESREIVIETGVEPNKTTMLLDIKSLLQVLPAVAAHSQYAVAEQNELAQNVFEEEDATQPEQEPVAQPEEPASVDEPVESQEPVQKPKAPTKKGTPSKK